MAEVATSPAAAPAVADKKKPEKPNAELFNERLATAEKEYQDSMAKYVCCSAVYFAQGDMLTLSSRTLSRLRSNSSRRTRIKMLQPLLRSADRS